MKTSSDIVIKSLHFESVIGQSYTRNNRTSGQKSLRCFPSCSEKGHVAGGFCGRSITVIVKFEKCGGSTENIEWENLLFLGQLHPSKQNGDLSLQKYHKKSSVLGVLRDCGQFLGREMITGELTHLIDESPTTATVRIAFNAKLHSWDYSWKSNRWLNETHVLELSVLAECQTADTGHDKDKDSDSLLLLGSYCSSEFGITSCHKKPSTGAGQGGKRKGCTSHDDEYEGEHHEHQHQHCREVTATSRSNKRTNRRTTIIEDARDSGAECQEGARAGQPQQRAKTSSRQSNSDSAGSFAIDMALVRHSCYLYDIQHRLALSQAQADQLCSYQDDNTNNDFNLLKKTSARSDIGPIELPQRA